MTRKKFEKKMKQCIFNYFKTCPKLERPASETLELMAKQAVALALGEEVHYE